LLYENEGKRRELFGGYYHTTNNRMELLGAVEALKALKEPCKVTLYSDSTYVVYAITKQWLQKWKKEGLHKRKNSDLWAMLDCLLQYHSVTFVWVKGHSGVAENERADELAYIGANSRNMKQDKRV
jgi:ribonuclease HI